MKNYTVIYKYGTEVSKRFIFPDNHESIQDCLDRYGILEEFVVYIFPGLLNSVKWKENT